MVQRLARPIARTTVVGLVGGLAPATAAWYVRDRRPASAAATCTDRSGIIHT